MSVKCDCIILQGSVSTLHVFFSSQCISLCMLLSLYKINSLYSGKRRILILDYSDKSRDV